MKSLAETKLLNAQWLLEYVRANHKPTQQMDQCVAECQAEVDAEIKARDRALRIECGLPV